MSEALKAAKCILPSQVTRDRALKEWLVEETGENINRNFGSGYPGGTLLMPHIVSVFINCPTLIMCL